MNGNGVIGDYSLQNFRVRFRFDLVDLNSEQFHGCWDSQTTTNDGPWCGWREGGAEPATCAAVTPCPGGRVFAAQDLLAAQPTISEEDQPNRVARIENADFVREIAKVFFGDGYAIITLQ